MYFKGLKRQFETVKHHGFLVNIRFSFCIIVGRCVADDPEALGHVVFSYQQLVFIYLQTVVCQGVPCWKLRNSRVVSGTYLR